MVAEVTLVRNFVLGMEKTNTIWTGHNTVPATDAPISVDQCYTILCLIGRTNRADLNTSGSLTLITQLWHKKSFGNIEVDFRKRVASKPQEG